MQLPTSKPIHPTTPSTQSTPSPPQLPSEVSDALTEQAHSAQALGRNLSSLWWGSATQAFEEGWHDQSTRFQELTGITPEDIAEQKALFWSWGTSLVQAKRRALVKSTLLFFSFSTPPVLLSALLGMPLIGMGVAGAGFVLALWFTVSS